MKRPLTLTLTLAALLGLGFLTYRKWFPGDETLIRRFLDDLAATVSVSHDEKPLTRLAKATRIASAFAPNAVFELDVSGFQDRTFDDPHELAQVIAAARHHLGELTIAFYDVTIRLAQDTAHVHATALGTGGNRSDPMAQELKMTLTKTSGHWRIQRVQTIRTLSP